MWHRAQVVEDPLAPDWLSRLLFDLTGDTLVKASLVQELWSGYGKILRCHLKGQTPSLIVKQVRWPSQSDHPRGWNSDLSHQRKVRSYQVEKAWYEQYAGLCSEASRVPHCHAVTTHAGEVVLVLEDLDASGFSLRSRPGQVSDKQIDACLGWLAHFHARFLGHAPTNLWETGTYWHLQTRPEELAVLADGKLKECASQIDALLKSSFQTLVHGDAKLANFCFTAEGPVGAVDFQYVGAGCGMKDVAYFLGSCLEEEQIEARESELLNRYFSILKEAVPAGVDFPALEKQWRGLYPVAWTDFFRFLQGWSPGHWKIHRYSERLAREVLERL